MKRLPYLVLCALMSAAPAFAQTLPMPLLKGPLDPSQTLATLNSLIIQINNVLVPALGPSSSPSGTLVNQISMTGGLTGSPGVIGLQPGADANAGIQINPNGSGNIILFGQGDTGILQFGNQVSFTPTTGLFPAPGVVSGKEPFGMSDHLTGYWMAKDWLGRSHGTPAY
jgi:hypothetical protein